MSAIELMTWEGFARSVVWHHSGLEINRWDADLLLWGHTGFPSFWTTKDPVRECEAQIIEYLEGR